MSDFVDSLWVPVLPSLSLSWLVLLLPVLVELKRFIMLMRLLHLMRELEFEMLGFFWFYFQDFWS